MLVLLIGLRFYFLNASTKGIVNLVGRTTTDFILLLFVVGLIAAAGYLINDLVDVEVDKVNKPEKKLAYTPPILYGIYVAMNGLAVFISLLLDLNSIIQLILLSSIILLFIYSFLFQKLPLIGNLTVAFLAGMLPLLSYNFVVLTTNNIQIGENLSSLSVLLLYVYFGFGITLLRELVKDIEDLKGDEAAHYKTYPVVVGVKSSQVLFYMLVSLFCIGMGFLNHFMINNFVVDNWFYYTPTFILLGWSSYQVYEGNYSKASLFLKICLFSGVLILFVV